MEHIFGFEDANVVRINQYPNPVKTNGKQTNSAKELIVKKQDTSKHMKMRMTTVPVNIYIKKCVNSVQSVSFSKMG